MDSLVPISVHESHWSGPRRLPVDEPACTSLPLWTPWVQRSDAILALGPSSAFEAHLKVRQHLVSFTDGPRSTRYAFGSEPMRAVQRRPGSFVVVPADTDVRVISTGQSRLLTWAIEPEVLQRVAMECTDEGEVKLVPGMNVTDPLMAQVAAMTMQCLDRPTAYSALHLDTLIAIFLCRLIEHRSSQSASFNDLEPDGRLGPPMRRVMDYVDSNLNGDVTLDDLAEIASMSPYYFARSFKAAVGLPPHQYVVRRRIDRAMRLLAATDQTIAHIAFDCGFASQAHMTTVFKRLTGTTPHRYRRSINA